MEDTFANLPHYGASCVWGTQLLREFVVCSCFDFMLSALLFLCFFSSLLSCFSACLLLCLFSVFLLFGWFVSVRDAGLLHRRRFNADCVFTRRMLYQLSKGGICCCDSRFTKHVLYQLSEGGAYCSKNLRDRIKQPYDLKSCFPELVKSNAELMQTWQFQSNSSVFSGLFSSDKPNPRGLSSMKIASLWLSYSNTNPDLHGRWFNI